MKDLEQAVHVIRALVEGRPIEYEGTMLELPWTTGERLPVWVAGYGPVALKLTGRIADGAMLQIGDPDLVRWFVSQVRDSAALAGRDPGAVKVMAAAPAHVGDLAEGRDRTRWFPALVANHVVDLVNKYPREDLPPELTTYVREREGYDYLHHAEVGSSNAAFVTDEIVDRFCLVGSAADHLVRLRELAAAGVDQFNLYLMNGKEEEQLELYGREIIPAMRDAAPASA
jgi:alkanesulfonate monooxygenase SsuD/methylene tetrahydromethanopterin reductase-like flavin-dependent oxidoreductase (luciferase family)